MLSVDELKKVIEKIVPARFAMEWDNSGFQVNLHNETHGILLCLDVTEEIIEEAKQLGYGLILSHHPLLFRGIKCVDAASYQGKCLVKLMEYGISLYSAHTSADAAPGGINTYLADLLGLKKQTFIEKGQIGKFYKVAVTVPVEHAGEIRKAMMNAGAGELGNYTGCSFSVEGMGSFRPDEGANPHIGQPRVQEFLDEVWIQALSTEEKLEGVLCSIREAHPYEEPAIDVFVLQSPAAIKSGMGVCGELQSPLKTIDFLERLKQTLEVDSVRFSGDADAQISKVALAGGASGDLVIAAEKMGAQIFITGELKHSQYYETGIALVEAGHFDTEKCFCGMMLNSLQKEPVTVQYNVDVCISDKMRRPFMNY